MKVINEGNGFVLVTVSPSLVTIVSVTVFAFSQGKTCKVTETRWWIISWVTGDWEKMCIACASVMACSMECECAIAG